MNKGRGVKYYIDENECWVCTSHKLYSGNRIKITSNGKQTTVSKLIYEEMYGEIEQGFILVKMCNNSYCINPDHHEPMDRKEWARSKELRDYRYNIDDNGCFICTSHKPDKRGRLVTMRNRKSISIIKLIWIKHYGEIPISKYVLQKCRNPLCINIDHLFLSDNPNEHRRKEIEYTIHENGCWESINVNANGKPRRLNRDGHHVNQLRMLFEEKYFPVPDGYNMTKTCGNLSCINPDHASLTQHTRVTKPITFAIDPNTECHIITSHYAIENGYGYFQINGKKRSIHRYVYENKYGKLKQGEVIRHKCNNKHCINVDHMTTGTISDNTRDAVRDGLMRSKLKKDDVIKIRRSKKPFSELAKEYGVTKETIRRAYSGITWKCID